MVATTSILVAGLVIWFLANRSGGPDGTELRAHGDIIRNASTLIEEAETAVAVLIGNRTRAGDEATTGTDLLCWFSYPEGGEDPHKSLRCGPVLFADSPEDQYWLHVPVSFRHGTDDGVLASIAGPTYRRTWALEAGEDLRRPDGREPPEDPGLERPPAEVAEPGATGEARPEAVMVDLEPEGGLLTGVGYELEVVATGTADRMQLEERLSRTRAEQTVWAAPEGERWFIVEVAGDVDTVILDADLEFALQVDGDLRSVDVQLPVGAWPVNRRLVASVPDGAEEIALIIDDSIARHGWSFTTRSRTEETPDIFYRDEASRTAALHAEDSLPYGAEDGVLQSEFGENTFSLEIGEAHLHYALALVDLWDPVVLTAGGPDRALLHLTGVIEHWTDSRHGGHRLTPGDVVLELEDGTRIEATHLSPVSEGLEWATLAPLDDRDDLVLGEEPTTLFDGFFVWDVPADIDSATLIISPPSGPIVPAEVDAGEYFALRDFDIDFDGGKMEFEITFTP